MKVQTHSVDQVNNSSVHYVNTSQWRDDLLVHLLRSVTVLHSGYYSLKTRAGNGHCFNRW